MPVSGVNSCSGLAGFRFFVELLHGYSFDRSCFYFEVGNHGDWSKMSHMKFFIPSAKDSAQVNEVYEGTRKFVGQQMAATLSPRKIYRLEFVHEGKACTATVGETFERLHEPVIAILFDASRNLYLICTPNRGVLRGEPYLAGSSEIRSVEDFDA
jgi:hypothetical protein